VEGSCEHDIEPSGSIKCWEVLEGLHDLAAPQEGLRSVSKKVSISSSFHKASIDPG
jgi:hypothetical protein